MKTAGLIGGLGPETTIEYYRLFVSGYRERITDGSYPSLLINSIDLQGMLSLVERDDLDGLTALLVRELGKLQRAGADFGLLAANTPHIVFDDVRRQSPIPLISIVQTALSAARKQGLRRLALFGTRFTMRGQFYSDVFGPAGVELVAPGTEEQDYIHTKYMGELVKGIVLPETRERLLAIVRRLRDAEGIDGLILGGTELSLILRDPTAENVPVLDTAKLHVAEALTLLLS